MSRTETTTTKARLRANRKNARKSTGPKTPEGKARSSRNALKHGLLARHVIIDDDPNEDPAEFNRILEGLIADAHVKKLVTPAQLHDVAERAGRRKAAVRLRAALADSPGITRSEAERILRRLLREAGIEQPLTDHPVGIYRADFAWPAYQLIVEFDSYSHHGHKLAFHHDRERNGWLTAQGWSVLPITNEQVTDR